MSESAFPLQPVSRAARVRTWFCAQHAEMWRHVARSWKVYLLLLLAGAAAAHWLGLNMTDSVPERLVWLERGALPQRGDLIVFRFEAASGPAKPLDGMRWLKRVRGVPGDRIVVVGRTVYVNELRIGTVLERTPKGSVMHPIPAGVIPDGHYFIGGSDTNSLDSRYSEIGLVRSDQLIARAHPLL